MTFHLPMVPELPVSMLACARLGVIHSEVFGGFSGAACGDRIADSGSRVLVTMDGYYRGGELVDHKAKADEAVATAPRAGRRGRQGAGLAAAPGPVRLEEPDGRGPGLLRRRGAGRLTGAAWSSRCRMPAEAPLFLMYTSGTTARPKGCQHSTGGYLAYVAGTSKYYQDIHPEDTYWCMADIGWITGHSYIVYGPLALGTTSVMYEGAPNYPDAGRPWRIAERLGVTIFHTAPTAIRMLRKLGPDEPAKYDYHFKHMTTVGEPIEPDVWRWYHESVGKGDAVIVDTWWQTENGGFLGSTLPALEPMKPGSCGPGVLGVYPVINDENGDVVEAGSGKAGNICIRNPWPGIFQTIWGQPERFVQIYYEKYCRNPDSTDWRDWPYFAGDGAVQAADGYFRILGRVDDVINVAGHRLGTKELESASHHRRGDRRGRRGPRPGRTARPGGGDVRRAQARVHRRAPTSSRRWPRPSRPHIGKIARPKHVWIVADMPKTRSGKIMRRVIAAISNFQEVGDTTTLSNPEIVDDIRHHVQAEKVARGETPRELTPQEAEEIKSFGHAE